MSDTSPSVIEHLGSPVAFGLIVIGDEILKGRRRDAHFDWFRDCLSRRGHELGWHWLLPDDPDVLGDHLGFSMSRGGPVFVCGGIGATPDDHTRECAARAAGVELLRHPQAAALIEQGFGPAAYPNRILMAELPAGSDLIPNPVNGIAGFSIKGHWFLPGFPRMAWPMAEWVLERFYGDAAPLREYAVNVYGVPESELISLMQAFNAAHPGVKLFSLPHLGENPHIRLGCRGRRGLEEAFDALRDRLGEVGIMFREEDE